MLSGYLQGRATARPRLRRWFDFDGSPRYEKSKVPDPHSDKRSVLHPQELFRLTDGQNDSKTILFR
jgi:hypothetical protein